MNLFGLEIRRKRDAVAPISSLFGAGQPVGGPDLWSNIFSTLQEPFPGAWQRGITGNRSNILAFSAVFCCVTGIASDIAKLRIKLSRNNGGIWKEIEGNSPWKGLLKKPNDYQVRYKFTEQWILSKLLHGNAYILKERDGRGIVYELYCLDPSRVKPLVSESGEIFYQLGQDNLSGIEEQTLVPASEIIHDSMPALFHPLCGTSPLYACAVSAQMGDSIQSHSRTFFVNRSLPSGMLTAPGRITDEAARRMKEAFERNFSGKNLGRMFVGGDGLEFKPFTMTAEQSQLIEQLQWSVSDVARAFHYPEYKLGGPLPPYSGNMEALTLSYYTDCLQPLMESMEDHLDDGLELPPDMGTEFDTDNLLRMDTASLYESNSKAVGGGWMEPDEARFRANLEPVDGGNTPYLQQQNYSLAALAKRDAQADPFASKTPAAPNPAPPEPVQPQREDATADLLSFLNSRSAEGLAFGIRS